jgi:hypothetical protein
MLTKYRLYIAPGLSVEVDSRVPFFTVRIGGDSYSAVRNEAINGDVSWTISKFSLETLEGIARPITPPTSPQPGK